MNVPVVDAHVHFWDPARLSYSWLDDVPALRRAFLPEHYPPFAAAGATGAVFVEANCAPAESLAEVALVDTLMTAEPRIAAVVAFVDLLDATHRAATLASLSRSGRVAGIRQNIQGRPASLSRDPAFVRGVQEAGALGFTFDVCVTADQLPEVVHLARACPGTRLVLDHCGKPAIRDNAFVPWAEAIARLATFGNVHCKLSGLLTEARPDQRTDEALHPYATHVLGCFGAERLFYGSDWPVVELAGGLAGWHAFTDRFTAGWRDADRRAFYADNAVRFYGLPSHAES